MVSDADWAATETKPPMEPDALIRSGYGMTFFQADVCSNTPVLSNRSKRKSPSFPADHLFGDTDPDAALGSILPRMAVVTRFAIHCMSPFCRRWCRGAWVAGNTGGRW